MIPSLVDEGRIISMREIGLYIFPYDDFDLSLLIFDDTYDLVREMDRERERRVLL